MEIQYYFVHLCFGRSLVHFSAVGLVGIRSWQAEEEQNPGQTLEITFHKLHCHYYYVYTSSPPPFAKLKVLSFWKVSRRLPLPSNDCYKLVAIKRNGRQWGSESLGLLYDDKTITHLLRSNHKVTNSEIYDNAFIDFIHFAPNERPPPPRKEENNRFPERNIRSSSSAANSVAYKTDSHLRIINKFAVPLRRRRRYTSPLQAVFL